MAPVTRVSGLDEETKVFLGLIQEKRKLFQPSLRAVCEILFVRLLVVFLLLPVVM